MIKTYIYNGNEVAALYKGGNLIYKKEPEKPKNILAGKFTQPGEYTFKINMVDTPVPLNDDLSFEIEIDDLTTCNRMFLNSPLSSLDSVPHTGNVTDMQVMFYGCKNLTNLDLSTFDTSNVTNMYMMFRGCTSLSQLDLSSFDTSNVTTMYQMFYNCTSLSQLDLSSFDTSNVTDMYMMFIDCSSLEYLDLSSFNTSNVTTMFEMFSGCKNLTNLDLGIFDFSSLTNTGFIFSGCKNLKHISGTIKNVKLGIDLKYSPLTNSSAMVFINGLAEVTSTKKITFKSTTFSTLTEEQIALATSKGWSVVSG